MLEGGGMKMNKTFSVLSIYAYVYCLVPETHLYSKGKLTMAITLDYMESFLNMRRLIPSGGFASVYSNHVGMSEEWENKKIKE